MGASFFCQEGPRDARIEAAGGKESGYWGPKVLLRFVLELNSFVLFIFIEILKLAFC